MQNYANPPPSKNLEEEITAERTFLQLLMHSACMLNSAPPTDVTYNSAINKSL